MCCIGMEIAAHPPPLWPRSIQGINNLPSPQKYAIYRTLLVSWMYTRFNIDPQTLTQDGQPGVHINCPAGSRAMEMGVWHQPGAEDPVMYINMVDTLNNQLLVLLAVISDPASPRFPIDRNINGMPAFLGTRRCNIPAEVAAMQAGLAPGQVRAGLRGSHSAVPVFECFVRDMGHDLFLIEPLAHHNAITFERYGFNSISGQREMERIHREFQPRGELHHRLDGSSPFRQPEAWRIVRGRSWAIRDGILGHSYTGFQMYKRIGDDAGVNTFPGAIW